MSAARGAQQERPLAPLEKAAQKVEGRLLWMQRLLNQTALRAVRPRIPARRGRCPSTRTLPPTPRRVDSGVSAGRLPPIAPGRAPLQPHPLRADRLVGDLSSSCDSGHGHGPPRPRSRRRHIPFRRLRGHELGHRDALAGRGPIPASNMYESLLFLAWGSASSPSSRPSSCATAWWSSTPPPARADHGPHRPAADRPVHPPDAPGALGHAGLAIHVPIIMVSYAVLALGVVIAHMQIGFAIFAAPAAPWPGR